MGRHTGSGTRHHGRPEAAPRAATGVEPVDAGAWCPECGMPAWVEWADEVGSTSGAVRLVKLRCFARHWFLMPDAGVPR